MEVEGDTQIHEAPSIWGLGVERDIVQYRDMDIERIIEEKTQCLKWRVWEQLKA